MMLVSMTERKQARRQISIWLQRYSKSARRAMVRGCELTLSWFGVDGREARNRDVQGVSRRELFFAVSWRLSIFAPKKFAEYIYKSLIMNEL
jgi:hypothetical protein